LVRAIGLSEFPGSPRYLVSQPAMLKRYSSVT